MKTFFKIIVVFLITQSALSQDLPLSTYENIPNDAHLKDFDNILLHYVGTWEGILNNKKYTFVFTKFPDHYNDFTKHFRDELMGNFKVTDLATNQVIYDNTAVTNYDDFRIFATTPSIIHGWCFFYFVDTEANCLNYLKFTLMNVTGQPNQLKYCHFEYDESWRFWDCPNFPDRMSIPVFLPKQDLILTKQ